MADQTATVTYLALGDSYTIGEAVDQATTYPHLVRQGLAERLQRDVSVRVIAKTGWTTGDLSAAMDAELDASARYELVSLLIGVNNQYQGKSLADYRSDFAALLARAVGLAGGRAGRVFVLSIPDYGCTPFGQAKRDSIARDIDAFNAANRQIADAAGVRYLDITPLTRHGLDRPELVAADQLHPSGLMYQQWTAAILPDVLRLFD